MVLEFIKNVQDLIIHLVNFNKHFKRTSNVFDQITTVIIYYYSISVINIWCDN